MVVKYSSSVILRLSEVCLFSSLGTGAAAAAASTICRCAGGSWAELPHAHPAGKGAWEGKAVLSSLAAETVLYCTENQIINTFQKGFFV